MEQRTKSRCTKLWLSGAALSMSLLGACSLSLDTDKNQCTKPKDCDSKVGGSSTQVCVKGFCEAVTCDTDKSVVDQDKECRSNKGRDELASSHCAAGICTPQECTKGGDECEDNRTCDTVRGVCVDPAKASCGLAGSQNPLMPNRDCTSYEGLETYICENKLCVEPKCLKDEDCTAMPGMSDTAICEMGICTDKTWGCIGEPDQRDAQTSGTATFKIKVVNVLGETPIEGLQVKVCGSTQLDPECALPLAGTSAIYDGNTGELTVSGLMPGASFRLTFEAPGFLPVDFYTQRLPQNETVESQPALLVPPSIVGSLESAFADKAIKVDLAMYGTVIARIFDCNDEPGAGASIQISEVVTGTEVFYLEGITVLPDDTETTASGSGGIANVKSNGTVDVSILRGTKLVTTFKDLRARTNRLTYINFYPRDYIQ